MPGNYSNKELADAYVLNQYNEDRMNGANNLPSRWNGNYGIYLMPIDCYTLTKEYNNNLDWIASGRLVIDLNSLDSELSVIKYYMYSNVKNIIKGTAKFVAKPLNRDSFNEFMDMYGDLKILKQLLQNRGYKYNKAPQICTYQNSVPFSMSNLEKLK